MTIDEIIGTWRSKDFPLFNYEDNITITLHIHHSHRATLWVLDAEKNTTTLSEGTLSIIDNENDNFEFVIDGDAIDNKYLNIQSRLYITREPSSFILNIPEYGERYLEKLN